MGYTKQNGEFANTMDINLSPASALSANAVSNAVEVGDKGVVRLDLVVAAIVGTLNVTIQGSKDGVTWASMGTFTAVSAPGSERKLFMADRFIRASYVVSGGPSATTLAGEAC